MDLLRRERVVLPGYTYLQDLVREALAFERRRLSGALEGLMSAEQAKSIDRLLTDDAGLHATSSTKTSPQSTWTSFASSSRLKKSPGSTPPVDS